MRWKEAESSVSGVGRNGWGWGCGGEVCAGDLVTMNRLIHMLSTHVVADERAHGLMLCASIAPR